MRTAKHHQRSCILRSGLYVEDSDVPTILVVNWEHEGARLSKWTPAGIPTGVIEDVAILARLPFKPKKAWLPIQWNRKFCLLLEHYIPSLATNSNFLVTGSPEISERFEYLTLNEHELKHWSLANNNYTLLPCRVGSWSDAPKAWATE